MELKLARAGPAVVFRVERGRLVIDEDTAELHDLVKAVTVFDPGCSLVIDLAKVNQLDCSGIGQLMQIREQVCDQGGIFGLLNVPARHKKLLGILGLLRVVPVFASLDEAVTACWSAQARCDFERDRRVDTPPWLVRPRPVDGFRPAMDI